MKKIAVLMTSTFMLSAAQTALAADAPWLADFRKADLNDSGGLSLVELDKSKSTLLKPVKEHFKAIDADGDGQVTAAEYERYLAKADDGFEAQFKKADLNDSGGLSRKELEKVSGGGFDVIEKNFDAVDADNDGQVSYAEYQKYHAKAGKVETAMVKDGCTDARHCGVVVAIDHYEEKGDGGATGMIIGGVAGGVVGKKAVGGVLGTVGGAAAGAYAGNEVQKHLSKKPMSRVSVRFDDGSQRSFELEGEQSRFTKGDRVEAHKGQLSHYKGN
jgi:outer membrane lipoprotein SlyB